MLFKEERLKTEFFKMDPIVRLMAIHFEVLCKEYFKITPVCTRIFDDIKGATGVHPAGRAIDFRNETGGKRMFTDEQVKFLVSEMNKRFPGHDNLATCIHHSFNGGPYHFHIQKTLGDKYDKDLSCFDYHK